MDVSDLSISTVSVRVYITVREDAALKNWVIQLRIVTVYIEHGWQARGEERE